MSIYVYIHTIPCTYAHFYVAACVYACKHITNIHILIDRVID